MDYYWKRGNWITTNNHSLVYLICFSWGNRHKNLKLDVLNSFLPTCFKFLFTNSNALQLYALLIHSNKSFHKLFITNEMCFIWQLFRVPMNCTRAWCVFWRIKFRFSFQKKQNAIMHQCLNIIHLFMIIWRVLSQNALSAIFDNF